MPENIDCKPASPLTMASSGSGRALGIGEGSYRHRNTFTDKSCSDRNIVISLLLLWRRKRIFNQRHNHIFRCFFKIVVNTTNMPIFKIVFFLASHSQHWRLYGCHVHLQKHLTLVIPALDHFSKQCQTKCTIHQANFTKLRVPYFKRNLTMY